MLNALEEMPPFFVLIPTVECLRAYINGYYLGAAERGYFDCLDLDGFEHWLRKKYQLFKN